MKHTDRQVVPDSETVVLMMDENTAVPQVGTLNDLPPATDGVLLVTAVKSEPEMDSQPQSNASSQSTRQPLQPVNRQISATPHHSQDSMPLKREQSLTPSNQAPSQPHMTAPLPATTSFPSHSAVPQHPRLFPNLPPAAAPRASAGFSTSLPSVPKQEPTPDAAVKPEPELEPETEYQPREHENLFSESQEEPSAPERGIPLAQLSSEETPERLEAGVQAGLKVLSELEVPLGELGMDNEDAQTWLQHIERVRKEAVQTRTVVGVVGNTGAGKSSVINAMLDEERLVPTNCMRACTAVVTELSYNRSNIETAKYRAEIEFIKPEEWRKELNVLFQEVFEDGHVSKEIANPDSEAGVAYAKIRAVYNKHTRDMLANSSIDSLMKNKRVQAVLGTTRRINSENASSFYKSLQGYVDSKEKSQQKLDKNGNVNHQAKREFEHWPLIKVVKIYTKSPALATGAVIVDLPGVHDSNAARAAVAEGYMKQCTGLWIVAPINRAVDDKAAKTLLGDTFKRQLKFDGTYSAVTFICSKTDDISRTEAADSLQLGEQMKVLDDKLSDITIRRRDLKKEKKSINTKLEDYDATTAQLEDDADIWDDLLRDVENGKTVYAPVKSKKRKSTSASPPATKRRRRAIESDDEDEPPSRGDDNIDGQDEAEDHPASRQPLTTNDIDKKIAEFRQLKKEARREKMALKDRLKELDKLLDALEDEEFDIEAESSAICIAGRNEYSRGAIQQDFAQGIRELDMETAEEENPDDFDPDEEKRDYDEVARSLPVFCVSSRAYQRLCGRMKKDTEVAGFTDIAQTEVPQLQAHCKKLTVKGRQANCRRFLNSVKQLLLSLTLWSSDDGTGIKLTSQQRDAEKSFLVRKLKELEAHLETVVEETLKDATETLTDQLFAKLDPAVSSAISEALPKAESWGLPKPAGGLHWCTYRATVRRSGVFTGSSGARDFNNELTEPIYRQLATIWEKVFQRRLPNILLSFKKSATNVVKQFHAAVETRSRERGAGAARLNMLIQQLDQYSATFGDLCAVAVNSLNEGQREVNREFVPVITEAMEPAYSSAAEERGTGSFKRMKAHVTGHVDVHKTQMFGQASQQVRASLLKLCRTIKENMLGKADEVFLAMQRDYTSATSGVHVGDIKMSREERVARREIDQVITAADKHFQESLDSDLEELKAKFGIGNANDRIAEDDQLNQDDFVDVDDFVESDEEVDDDAGHNDESVEDHEDDRES